jgi:DNA modification methylase
VSEWIDRVFQHSCEQMGEIPDGSVHCAVTSPPYFGLREYGHDGQIGHERTVAEFVDRLVTVFREVRRVLRKDGTLWLNLGDSYAGSWGAQGRTGEMSGRSVVSARQIATHPHKRTQTGSIRDAGLKPKDLIGVPWRVAFALQADGWWLRDAVVWAKPNPMPSSVTDRCTSSYEMVFMLSKSRRYYADMDAVREPLAESSIQRLSQPNLENQEGSARANGGAKTNGNMKAVASGLKFGGNKGGGDFGSASRLKNGNEWVADVAKGANLRNVWTIATTPFSGDHPAVMPRELAERCILIGAPSGGVVLDPFMGSGTVAEVAIGNGRHFVGYELNPEYCALIRDRLGLFGEGVA